jgi:hypothetical protein
MFTNTRYFNPSFINTIEKDETYHGRWWLADNPNDKISGVLRLYKKGGIRLHLIGMFMDDSSESLGLHFADHDIILGELVPGNVPVTLIYCKERQRESPYIHNTAEAAVQRFKAEHLLFGHHVDKIESLKFTSFEFSTTYLVDWVNSRQIDIKFEGKNAVVSTLPKTNSIVKGEDYEIIITSWASTSLGGNYNSTQYTSVEVKLSQAIGVEVFKERFQNPILDLIQFGSSFLNSITFMNVKFNDLNDSHKLISTSEFDQISRETEPIKHYALFRLSDFEATWDTFIINWLKFHNKAQHIFRLYFDSMHIGFQFPVTKFLNIIQAIESYHSEREENEDINLRIRLNELFEESNGLFSKTVQNKETFITKCMDTRNYYTHYNVKKRIKAASGLELEALTNSLRLLLNFHLLVACQISKDKSKELITENYLFDYIMQLTDESNFWKKD